MIRPSDVNRFQSTPPARGATTANIYVHTSAEISIHAPREGGDCIFRQGADVQAISIHAPREGGDIGTGPTISQHRISIHAPREGGDSRE